MYIDETNILTRRFVKSTSSIGCVGTESNAPIDSNAGEPTRPCTSGIDYFGAEDGSSVESSTIEPSRSSCAATLVPQEQQCIQVIAVALAELHTTDKRPSVTNPLERHLADFSRDLVAMQSS